MKHKPHHTRLSVGTPSHPMRVASAGSLNSAIASTDSDTDPSDCSYFDQSAGSVASSYPDRDSSPGLSLPPSLEPSPSPPAVGAAETAHLGLAELEAFNDGTMMDVHDSYLDPYAAAWLCMTDEKAQEYKESSEYQRFASLLQDGKLALRERDLTTAQQWKALGYFLSHNSVSCLRFHGVDLQVSDGMSEMSEVMLSAELKRLSKQKSAAHSAGGSHCHESIEWTGGWGVDVDEMARERRRKERKTARNQKIRHVIFCDTQLGAAAPVSAPPTAANSARQPGAGSSTVPPASSASDETRSDSPNALQTAISLLLFCELLESVSLWRNNLGDEHATQLAQELLSKHPSLQRLSLRWNRISTQGAIQLGAILRNIHSGNSGKPGGGANLSDLDLADNMISEDGVQQLRADMAAVPCHFAGDEEASCCTSACHGLAPQAATTVRAAGTTGSSSSSSSRPRPPFFLNLQRQHAMPFFWRPQPQRMRDAHFQPMASFHMAPAQQRTVRPTA